MTHKSGKGYFCQFRLANSFLTAGLLAFSITFPLTNSAFAQSLIIPDNNLGTEKSQVINNYLNQPTEALTGGVTRGNNLFHSFLEFNVSEGRSAIFLSPNNQIQNILVRVTGSNPSEILGKLGTLDTNANLFFINPNGIFFGPKAALSVNGSFVASTASSIKFEDGNIFSATSPQTTPLLTVSVPIGLQFASRVGEIRQQGTLEVPIGKTLMLVGGNITLDATNIKPKNSLTAENGRIALGGILEPGTIGINLNSDTQLLSFPNNIVLADVSLKNVALVDVSGEGGGYIQIQGKHIMLTGVSELIANTRGSQTGRGISIQAEQLTLKDGSQVRASTRPNTTGAGGSLVVKATDFVVLSGTDAFGNPSALFAETFGVGPAGNLILETGKLIVENGAQVSATARRGSQGNGGKLIVSASDYIKLSGTGTFNSSTFPSGLFAQTVGSGNAGSLNIHTQQLIVQDGAQVTAGTGTDSIGNGGNLTINASDFVELSGTEPNGTNTSGLFARSRGSRDAGSLSLTTSKLIVRDQAQVTVSALGGGDAGNLEIKADEILLDREGKLIAQTKSGNGGNINLDVQNLLLLRNNSQISTTAGTDTAGGGNGGNINIDNPQGFIVAVPRENSDITANAYTGTGGDVNINAFEVYGIQFRLKPTELSDITASSDYGDAGTVEINTSNLDPNRGLINLPNQPLELKLSQVCQAVRGRNQNSFTITGRSGLPANPIESLSADTVVTDWITLDKVKETRSSLPVIPNPAPESIVEATGWVLNSQGEVILTASVPTIHNSWQKSNDCAATQVSSSTMVSGR
jgi:filamentous hemagglutinin family protein